MGSNEFIKASCIRSTELVDGLPWISYDKRASRSPDEGNQLLLGSVDILVFINNQVFYLRQYIRLFLQVRHCQRDHAIECQPFVVGEMFFVFFIGLEKIMSSFCQERHPESFLNKQHSTSA